MSIQHEIAPDAFGRDADGTPIPGRVRRSDRATRISLRVRPDGVELIVPARAAISGGLAFLQAKRAWIERTWARMRTRERAVPDPGPARYENGATFLHRGRALRLDVREDDVRRPRVEARDDLVVTVPRGLSEAGRQRTVSVTVRAWAWARLLEEATRLAGELATRLGWNVSAVRLTRARSRWGSCSALGVIRVNVALAAAPPDLLEYLVAHEVAHLRCRGHGPRFYATLARILPDWAERRARLREFERSNPGLPGA